MVLIWLAYFGHYVNKPIDRDVPLVHDKHTISMDAGVIEISSIDP
jgi:hypothetical protein